MALQWYSSVHKEKNLNIIKKGLLVFFLIGSLNLFIDIFVFSDNRSEHFASFINPEDYKAVRWVIENTPEDSIVQSLPMYYEPENRPPSENYRISLFSQIGERKMALGDSKWARFSQTAEDTVFKRKKDIYRMFETISPEEVWEIAYKYKINYVYTGTYEILKYHQTTTTLRSNKNLFKEVYDVNGVSIFQVLGYMPSKACVIQLIEKPIFPSSILHNLISLKKD